MRRLGNWLKGYEQYTGLIQEAPPILHLWTGIVTIASALGRKVWIEHPPKCLYTNLYVVFVSPPGRSRKSSAMKCGLEFLEEIQGVAVSAEDITMQAMIRDLAGSEQNFMFDGLVRPHASLVVVSLELSVFLGFKNLPLLAVLCDLYDAPDHWTYKTKNAGVDSIEGVWLTMFGATTPDWYASSLPVDAIGGGWTSRVIHVVTDERGKPIPRGKKPPEALKMAEDLLFDLEQIAVVAGAFEWSTDAGEFYDDWYCKYKPPSLEWWLTGYFERKPTHVVKVAMLLSIAENDDLIIEKRHIIQSIDLLTMTELNMPQAFGGIGRSATSVDTFKILKRIRTGGRISKTSLGGLTWMHLSSTQLAEVLTTLESAGKIKHDIDKGEIWYYPK